MKTLKNQLLGAALLIGALTVTGCASNIETDNNRPQTQTGTTLADLTRTEIAEPEIAEPEITEQENSVKPDTERLIIPTLPPAPRLALPDSVTAADADSATTSTSPTAPDAAPFLLEPLAVGALPDPFFTPQSITTADTPTIDDIRRPAAIVPDNTAGIEAPIDDSTPTAPVETAAIPNNTATDVKQRLKQTDDIKVITWRAERGHVDSQLILGKAYATGNQVETDLLQARLWLELASIQGDRQAQYELGQMYFSGNGVTQDLLTAREWWIESAISGDDRAQQRLGYMYSEGLGVERNFSQARNWYLKAANLGNAEAQTLLGSLYHEGNRLPHNYAEAFHWYQKAAVQGHPHAQYALAILYHDGLGIEADPIKCTAWVEVAVANGYVDDLGAGQECRKKLDQQSTIDADILADEWKKRYITEKQNS